MDGHRDSMKESAKGRFFEKEKKKAVIGEEAVIGEKAVIGEEAVVGEEAVIGEEAVNGEVKGMY